jgi:hypothetical protein
MRVLEERIAGLLGTVGTRERRAVRARYDLPPGPSLLLRFFFFMLSIFHRRRCSAARRLLGTSGLKNPEPMLPPGSQGDARQQRRRWRAPQDLIPIVADTEREKKGEVGKTKNSKLDPNLSTRSFL